jgi:hypothetical protein
MSTAAPKEAGSEYFWYAKCESDRVLLLDHNGHVLGGSVYYSDIDTIVRAHNERIRAAYKRDVANPVAPLIPAPEQEEILPSDLWEIKVRDWMGENDIVLRDGAYRALIRILSNVPPAVTAKPEQATRATPWQEAEIDAAVKAGRITFEPGWNFPPGQPEGCELPALPKKPAAWRHTMDNTEGIKSNTPWSVLSPYKASPFGKPGRDYSASYPVKSEALYSADQVRACIAAALAARQAPASVPLQAPEPAPESVRDAALVRAAEYLEGYAKYCYEVNPDDIERHPYIPSIEEAAADLRAMLPVAQEKAQ